MLIFHVVEDPLSQLANKVPAKTQAEEKGREMAMTERRGLNL